MSLVASSKPSHMQAHHQWTQAQEIQINHITDDCIIKMFISYKLGTLKQRVWYLHLFHELKHLLRG